MRKLLLAILVVLASDILFERCANIQSPSGGPKDTIPPTLLESNPKNGTTNFKGQEFTMEFSEFVKADKIQQQLIITPRTENKYKTIIKKNSLTIKFDDPFKDSTTYNLNFADGVTDITESNPVVNLSLAFSTGPFIDSLSISGNVIDLFEQENAEAYTVGLYRSTDTLDFFKEKPMYFTTTNDSGDFKLSYIKSGIYKLLVFDDENGNVTFDPETESHGFIKDSIVLDSSLIIAKPIATLLQNIKPITFINSRPTGPYIELKYSKTISDYTIQPDYLNHSITGESNDVIRIYKSKNITIGDSLVIYTNVKDSLNNQTIDTIRTTFIESNRKPSDFNYTPKSLDPYLKDNHRLSVNFNKPVYQIDTVKIQLIKDSTFNWPISPELIWNHNHTELQINSGLNRQTLLDTIKAMQPVDTAKTEKENSGKLRQKTPGQTTKRLPPIELKFEEGSFISIEKDTSQLKSIKIDLEEPTTFGTLKFTIQTNYKSFNIQLVDARGNVQYSIWNDKEATFPKVKAGKYAIRALIDNDADGKWSAGNLLLNIPPEDIYLHDEETSVREDWVLEIEITF